MNNVVSDYSDGIPSLSLCLIDPQGNVVAERDAHKEYYSASAIKLGVLVAAMQRVDAGTLDLDQQLVSTQTFSSVIPGAGEYSFDPEEVDPGMAPLGQNMSLREVLRRMIVVSSNEATNMVAQMIGVDQVTEAVAEIGAKNTVMGRLFGDYAALKAGRSITTTAFDLALLMRAVTTGAAAGKASTEFMLEVLQAQQYQYIGAVVSALNPKVQWGSKSGTVTGISHDVAFIAPDGDIAASYVLAICTRAFTEEEGAEAVRSVAALTLALNQVIP